MIKICNWQKVESKESKPALQNNQQPIFIFNEGFVWKAINCREERRAGRKRKRRAGGKRRKKSRKKEKKEEPEERNSFCSSLRLHKGI